jgi:hypothetical protein
VRVCSFHIKSNDGDVSVRVLSWVWVCGTQNDIGSLKRCSLNRHMLAKKFLFPSDRAGLEVYELTSISYFIYCL